MVKQLRLIVAALILAGVTVSAAAQTRTATATWTFSPPPEALGGMPLSDYLTNITFTIYTHTNCTVPLTNWTVIATNIPGTLARWPLTIDTSTRFFVMKAVDRKGGSSPFSNADFLLAPLITGSLSINP